MCCEMSHPRARPLPWLISRDEIQLNAPQSLLVLSILMVCAEYKEAVRCVGWKAGKQSKSVLCQQRLPGEELGAFQVPPTLCTRTGRTRRLGSIKPLGLSLWVSVVEGPYGCWWACTLVSLGLHSPSPWAEGLAWQWMAVALTPTAFQSALRAVVSPANASLVP